MWACLPFLQVRQSYFWEGEWSTSPGVRLGEGSCGVSIGNSVRTEFRNLKGSIQGKSNTKPWYTRQTSHDHKAGNGWRRIQPAEWLEPGEAWWERQSSKYKLGKGARCITELGCSSRGTWEWWGDLKLSTWLLPLILNVLVIKL